VVCPRLYECIIMSAENQQQFSNSSMASSMQHHGCFKYQTLC
jgi:hypothetical protein